MRASSIKETLARVRHDPLLEGERVCIEIQHRGAPGNRRSIECDRRSLRLAPEGFTTESEHFVPYHRVLSVRCGSWVWERSGDGMAGVALGPRPPSVEADPLPDALRSEAAGWGVRIDLQAWQSLGSYRQLIERGNRVHNLVSRSLGREDVERLIVDSLAALPLLGAGPCRLLDVGSGAGLPGLPLVLASPAIEAVLLEPSAKRAAFLVAAVEALGLERVSVRRERVEALKQEQRFHALCVRGLRWRRWAAAMAGQLEPGGMLLCFEAPRRPQEPAPGWRSLAAVETDRVVVRAWQPVSSESRSLAEPHVPRGTRRHSS